MVVERRSCCSAAMDGQPQSCSPIAHADSVGFTLIELVVVIVIIGILASFAVPRFFDNDTFAERGYFEELVASLRFAQKTAVATGCPVRAVISATDYSITQQQLQSGRCDPSDSTWATPIQLADGTTLDGSAPAGISATPSFTVIFDALGATNLGADQNLSVGLHSLVLQASSGYVDVP